MSESEKKYWRQLSQNNDVLKIFEAVLSKAELPEKKDSILRLVVIKNKSFEDIGDIYNLSGERIRQIFHESMGGLFRKIKRTSTLEKYNQELSAKNAQLISRIKLLEKEAVISKPEELSKVEELAEVETIFPIKEIDFSQRIYTVLARANISSLNQLQEYTQGQLLLFPNFGRKSLEELKKVMHEHGLKFEDKKNELF